MTATPARNRPPDQAPAPPPNTPARPPRQADAPPQFVSLRTLTDGERETARADLFRIDDRMFSIDTKPKVNTALRYLHIARTQGSEPAIDYMLGRLLGDEAYEALMSFDDLTEENLEQVITIASKIMAGAVETPKGKRKRG